MKKIELFGLSLTFKLNKKNADDAELYTKDHHLKEKIFYLILMIMVIVISSKGGYIINKQKYNVGDVAINDIYAPKSVLFNDKDKKQDIIKNLMESSKKEYIYVPQAGTVYISAAEYLFDEILKKNFKKNKLYLDRIEDVIGKPLPTKLITGLTQLNKKELLETRERVIGFLTKAYATGIIREKGILTISPPNDEAFEELTDFDKKIVENFLTANYIYDETKTKNSIAEKISQIDDQILDVKAGTLLVKKGDIITESKSKLLEVAGIYSYKKSLGFSISNLLYTIILTVIFYPLLVTKFKKNILNKNIYRSLFLIYTIGFLVFRFTKLDHIYFVPFETMYFLMGILFAKDFAILTTAMAISYLFPIVGYDPVFVIVTTLVCIMGTYLIEKVTTRQELIALGMKLAVTKFFLYLLLTYFIGREQNLVVLQSGEIVVSGLLSGMLAIAVLPYFEKTFNILTTFRLLELGDLSHPLLKLLSMKAPGTFHHSMMVATLSEAAAEAIGANAIFARVASYYHDIGKMKRPKFYVENQEGGENPHSKISPFLSNLIITSHTKDGNELGREYKIPREIRDVMFEHQGTTMLAYFYNKAKQLDPTVIEDDFRYSGPTPRSKESAIIMLADSVEAAVRSIDEKTPITIENMLRKIINAKIEENQLSEAALTFKEIEIIIKTFTKVLMSIHHVRIKYPGQK
ncbi:HDIG domain-containing protein [Cetobacterium sp. 8H]|uniref:HD family phosphohydrolase n=1 Tax=Cetobacterium sp. 8H TaxID=2759681 RepID=UPI00163C0605|nr:HDIG domain-containing metalloprotein [Cetobacterium sp. 8H]MBC2851594.1 HDIG domain-containing protein [Cetobacterium sp. 8H]